MYIANPSRSKLTELRNIQMHVIQVCLQYIGGQLNLAGNHAEPSKKRASNKYSLRVTRLVHVYVNIVYSRYVMLYMDKQHDHDIGFKLMTKIAAYCQMSTSLTLGLEFKVSQHMSLKSKF
mgnify:FL=1